MPAHRSGLTLLELILALALTSLILAFVGMAVDLHLRSLDARRSSVEDAQLARAVLRLIADDLRSAVQYKAVDFTGLEAIVENGTGQAGNSAGQSNSPDAAPDEGGPSTGDENAEEDASGTVSVASSIAPPTVPGLYGSQYELQVDISRLPRVDEYQALLSTGDATFADIPSDVKTVAYYVVANAATTGSSASVDMARNTSDGTIAEAGAFGLVRRELDRAVTLWAANQGNLDILQTSGIVVAPEVTELEFRYFDGTQWLTEWDSNERQGLPVAVEIIIGIQRVLPLSSQSFLPSSFLPAELAAEPDYYSLVVHLPMAEPAAAEETADSEAQF